MYRDGWRELAWNVGYRRGIWMEMLVVCGV
jgi:hypothetical protein